MALGRILKAPTTGTSSLIQIVQKAATRTGVVAAPTKTSKVRVSGLHQLCVRQALLMFKHNVSAVDDIGADLGVTFALGTGMHSAMQNELLPKSTVFEGMWRCTRCGFLHGDMPYKDHLKPAQIASRCSRPSACSKCNSPQLIYEEYHFVNEELALTGHCDGLLNMPAISDSPVLFELKSIAQSQTWKLKDTPIMDHVIQVHGYMLLSELKHAVILYWIKGVFGMPAFREFHVEWNEELGEGLRADLIALKAGLEAGTVTPDRVCATADCSRAMDCPVRKPCFEGHAPEADSATGLF